MKVKFTAWAEKCLVEIQQYYFENAGPDKSDEIINKIIDKAESLIKYPERGKIEEDLKSLNKGHRYLLEYHYKIIYVKEGDTVYITDIFSNWQNPAKKQKRYK